MTLYAAAACWLHSVALWSMSQHATFQHQREVVGMGKQGRTLALAFLQFVQALGVTESGTFLFLPAEVPGVG